MRHNKIAYALAALLAISCGSKDKDKPKNHAPVTDQAPAPEEPEAYEETESEIVDHEITSPKALYVTAKDKMGECSEENQDQLTYVRSEKRFYVCDQSTWSEAEVTVEYIVPEPEPDPDAVEDGQWRDPYTKRVWEYVGDAEGSPLDIFDGYTEICSKVGMSTPTRVDVEEAAEHGIWAKYLNDFDLFSTGVWFLDYRVNPMENADPIYFGYMDMQTLKRYTGWYGLRDRGLGQRDQVPITSDPSRTVDNYRPLDGVRGVVCYGDG